MWNIIDRFKSMVKTRAPAKTPVSKHLKMRVVYGAHHTGKLLQPVLNEAELLANQQQYLQSFPATQDAAIEKFKLDKDTLVLGLNKHRLVWDGVFMYPLSIENSDEWSTLVARAREEDTGIGVFKVQTDCECLKITGMSGVQSEVYMINKSYLVRNEWRLHPAEIANVFDS